MLNPGYAAIGRLLDGDTIARRCGVAVGDIIVAVIGEGFRRFKAEYKNDELEDLTKNSEGMDLSAKQSDDQDTSGKVVTLKTGESYAALLAKIKRVKQDSDPSNPLVLSLERYSWDSRVHAWPRFLVARDGDVPAAMKMQQEHESWRDQTFPIDLTDAGLQKVIHAKAVSEIDIEHEDLPPTVYVNFVKLAELEADVAAEDVVKAFIMFTESLLKRSHDPRSAKMSQFIDLTSVSITNGLRTDILRKVYATFEPNYPETLYKMVLYPVSKYVVSEMVLNDLRLLSFFAFTELIRGCCACNFFELL